MIVVVLQGGLGNQMFQYATGRSVAIARGADLLLSLAELSPRRRGPTPRAYELGAFGIVSQCCDAAQEREIKCAIRLGKIAPLLTRWNVHAERKFGFDAGV